jgi:nicotinate-nucleotide adenylyltransferase
MRIGLYGGSFDPVHLGHLLVARAACEELNLDRLFFIPAAQSPFKSAPPPIPAAQRLRLLHLALAGETRMAIDSQEIERGGVSYTIDTVRAFRNRFPEAALCYLIGADHVALLPRWRDAEALAALAEFAVIPRPGEPPATVPMPFHGKSLCGFPFAVSSSQIRARIQAGLPIDHLTVPAVAEAIRINRLYL